jgi:inositol oxygenase
MCGITTVPAQLASDLFLENRSGGSLKKSQSSIDVRHTLFNNNLTKRVGSFEDLSSLSERSQRSMGMDSPPTRRSTDTSTMRPSAGPPLLASKQPASNNNHARPLQLEQQQGPRHGDEDKPIAATTRSTNAIATEEKAGNGISVIAPPPPADNVAITSIPCEAEPPTIAPAPKDASRFFYAGRPLPVASSPLRSTPLSSPRQPTSTSESAPPSVGQRSPEAEARTSMDLDLVDSRRSSVDLGPLGAASGHLSEGHAAEELFYRLNHARQTFDYVKRQATAFSQLNRAEMDVWEALQMLDSLREYEAALLGAGPDTEDVVCDIDMSLMEHALQTAEACRLEFPEHDWMALVGLLHGLGKLLAHQSFGAEPQWAVCGESFPVGCRFHPAIVHSQYFAANPDRRRRMYATPTGVYAPRCGLTTVLMSWSAAEYLYLVLIKNRTVLPPEALFVVRHQKFAALLRPGQPYGELLSPADRAMLPLLKRFRELVVYQRVDVPGRLEGEALRAHYDALLSKYIPQGKLRW